VNRPRAADDFATIRARMEELRQEREGAHAAKNELERDQAMRHTRSVRWPPSEISARPGRVRQPTSADTNKAVPNPGRCRLTISMFAHEASISLLTD